MNRKRVLSTWIVLDDTATASNYPQAGRRSSADPRVQAFYWRCIAAFFAVAKRTCEPDILLRLYTNNIDNVSKSQPDVSRMLLEASVEVKEVPLEHLPPAGYYGRWRNQFYILDIIRSIAEDDEDGSYIVLDCDCLCLHPLGPVFNAIEEKGALTMITGERLGNDVNGLTREQMQTIFEEIGREQLSSPPEYYGGEFFAADFRTIQKIKAIAEDAWLQSLERFHAGRLKFNEEAHLLSYVYFMLGLESGSADPFVKRLWTGLHYRNGLPEDANKTILHLPGEKRFGYLKLFNDLQRPGSWFYREKNDLAWRRRMLKLMSAPTPSLQKLTVEFLTYGTGRVLRLLEK